MTRLRHRAVFFYYAKWTFVTGMSW